MQDNIFTYKDELFWHVYDFNMIGYLKKEDLAENAYISVLDFISNRQLLQKFPSHYITWTSHVKSFIQKVLVKMKMFWFL